MTAGKPSGPGLKEQGLSSSQRAAVRSGHLRAGNSQDTGAQVRRVPAGSFPCCVASGKSLLCSPSLGLDRVGLDDPQGTVWDSEMPRVLLFS